MDGCPAVLDTLVSNGNFTWREAHANVIANVNAVHCFRPDVGVALMPWVYTVVVIVIHLPIVLIRVTRWEIVQVRFYKGIDLLRLHGVLGDVFRC